jgi:hypothetical protein
LEAELVVDKAKLPGDLWARMMWAPKAPAGIQERPIVLVGERRRWIIGLVASVLGFLLLIALAVVRVPVVLLLVPMALALGGARYGASGRSGYYEIREDGSLGDFLGRRTPLGLSQMRRTKA